MAKDFDELLEYLVEEIAVYGEKGALVFDFKQAFLNFYSSDTSASASIPDSDHQFALGTDRQLQEAAWTWLISEPDVWVGRLSSDTSPFDILVGGEDPSPTFSLPQAEASDSTADENNQVRLWTSHERVWQVLTGHGVDFQRIPLKSFELLSLIIAAGPNGIAQPDLTQLSKQDKKSVPGRTDELFDKGYIRKKRVLIAKRNTSILIHRRYLHQEDPANPEPKPVFSNGSLSFENLLHFLTAELKDGKDMKMDDLESLLDCRSKSWEKKSLWRALERLDIIALIQRFRRAEPKSESAGSRKWKCVRLLRQPTDEDFKNYFAITQKQRDDFRRRLEAQDADAQREHAEYQEGDDTDPQLPAPVPAIANPSLTTVEGPSCSFDDRIITPQWDPDLPWTNVLYNAFKASGHQGLSTMIARSSSFGEFYARPLEQMLARLTDDWQAAQPEHLRYLSVIRDTASQDRSTYYLYRAFDAFREAVARGESVWETVTSNRKPYMQPNLRLDANGFPMIDGKILVKQGIANLSECLANARIKVDCVVPADPVLARKPDGTVGVKWKPTQPGKKSGPRRKALIHSHDVSMQELPGVSSQPAAERGYDDARDVERLQAEMVAYRRARDEQILAPAPVLTGRQVIPTFKPGSGFLKLVILDDTAQPTNGEASQTMTTDKAKRRPIFVLESRIQAIMQELLRTQVLINPPGSAPDFGRRSSQIRSKSLVVVVKSTKLKEFGWFRDSVRVILPEFERNEQDFMQIEDIHQSVLLSTENSHREAQGASASPLATDYDGGADQLEEAAPRRPDAFHTDISRQAGQLILGIQSRRLSEILAHDTLVQYDLDVSNRRHSIPVDAPSSSPAMHTPQAGEGLTTPRSNKRARSLAHGALSLTKRRRTREPSRTPAVPAEQELPQPASSENAIVQEDPVEPHASEELEFDGVEPESFDTPTRRDWAQRESTYIRFPGESSKPERRKKGTVVGGGTAQHKRALLVMRIIEKCGGIFPGNSEIVIPYQKLQMQETTGKTDRDTILKAARYLVETGKLKREPFDFKDAGGNATKKYIFMLPNIDPLNPKVQELKQKMQEALPKNYLPPEVDETNGGKIKQNKNIDRFLYEPDKSGVKPQDGTKWVIDIEAKRREMEQKRLAEEEKKRNREAKRLQAQAAKNKEKQKKLAAKQQEARVQQGMTDMPQQPAPTAGRPLQEILSALGPPSQTSGLAGADDVLPSIENDTVVSQNLRPGRTRYREIRPRPPLRSESADGEGVWVTEDPYGTTFPINHKRSISVYSGDDNSEAQDTRRERRMSSASEENAVWSTLTSIDFSSRRSRNAPTHNLAEYQTAKQPMNQLVSSVYHQSFAPLPPKRTGGQQRAPAVSKSMLVHDMLVFKEPQGPHSFDPFFEIQDTASFLDPGQRFHANTGTFSTDFFIRRNARTTRWREPSAAELTFENHTSTNPRDIQMYKKTDDYDNHYHPDKKARKSGPGLLSRRVQALYSDEESDDGIDASWFEKHELEIMKEQYPGLIHQKLDNGFINLSFDHSHEFAKDQYGYGVKPLERIVLMGVSTDELPRGFPLAPLKRPNIPGIDPGSDLAYGLPPVPMPARPTRTRGTRRPLAPRRADMDFPELEPQSTPRVIKQSGNCYISSSDARRLLFAVIAVRTLSGELEQNIRWTGIRDVFANHPNFDMPTFKARWVRMQSNHRPIVERVQREFQDAFLRAYEEGDIPPLDITGGTRLMYKNTDDWGLLVDWAVKAIPVFPDELQLPAKRSMLGDIFEITPTPLDVQDLREKMEHMQATNSKREEVAHILNFALPLRCKNALPSAKEDLAVARSWARANCATRDADFDGTIANAKLRKIDNHALGEATAQLHVERVLAHSHKGRTKPGRNYHLSDQYNHIFGRRPLESIHFIEAVAFKKHLDTVMASATPRLMLDFTLADGAIMALTELLAAGRVCIAPVLPPINSSIGDPWPRLTVWGFTEGVYRLRNMDKRIFLWDVEIFATDNYVMGIPVEQKIRDLAPPMGPKQDEEGMERIPIWRNIHDKLLPKFWAVLLRCVLQHIALKAGSSIKTLATPFKGLIWDWEVELLVEWLVEVGVAGRTEGGGVMAKEWWWAIVSQFEEGDQDVLESEMAGENTSVQAQSVIDIVNAAAAPMTPLRKKRRTRGGTKVAASA